MKILIYLIQLLSTHPPWKLPASRQGRASRRSSHFGGWSRDAEGSRVAANGAEQSRTRRWARLGSEGGRKATQLVDERGTVYHRTGFLSFLLLFSLCRASFEHFASLVTAVQPASMIRETIHGIRGKSGLQWFTVSQIIQRFCFRHLRYANVRHNRVSVFGEGGFFYLLFFFFTFLFLYIYICMYK